MIHARKEKAEPQQQAPRGKHGKNKKLREKCVRVCMHDGALQRMASRFDISHTTTHASWIFIHIYEYPCINTTDR